jgi:hypothetical protein
MDNTDYREDIGRNRYIVCESIGSRSRLGKTELSNGLGERGRGDGGEGVGDNE